MNAKPHGGFFHKRWHPGSCCCSSLSCSWDFSSSISSCPAHFLTHLLHLGWMNSIQSDGTFSVTRISKGPFWNNTNFSKVYQPYPTWNHTKNVSLSFFHEKCPVPAPMCCKFESNKWSKILHLQTGSIQRLWCDLLGPENRSRRSYAESNLSQSRRNPKFFVQLNPCSQQRLCIAAINVKRFSVLVERLTENKPCWNIEWLHSIFSHEQNL